MKTFKINDNTLTKITNKNISLFNDCNICSIISPDELKLITDINEVSKYIQKECQLNNHHLRIDHHPKYIYGILSVVEIFKNKLVSANFNFFLTNNSLVIVIKPLHTKVWRIFIGGLKPPMSDIA